MKCKTEYHKHIKQYILDSIETGKPKIIDTVTRLICENLMNIQQLDKLQYNFEEIICDAIECPEEGAECVKECLGQISQYFSNWANILSVFAYGENLVDIQNAKKRMVTKLIEHIHFMKEVGLDWFTESETFEGIYNQTNETEIPTGTKEMFKNATSCCNRLYLMIDLRQNSVLNNVKGIDMPYIQLEYLFEDFYQALEEREGIQFIFKKYGGKDG